MSVIKNKWVGKEAKLSVKISELNGQKVNEMYSLRIESTRFVTNEAAV